MKTEDIIKDLQNRFNHLVIKNTWGEISIFYNPNETLTSGTYFLTIKESDGENDQASNLNRDNIFRASFGVSKKSYEALFGHKPPRPAKGEIINTGHDFTQTNLLMPHPIYAWMRWLQILNPSQETWNSNQYLIQESYQLAKTRFEKRKRRVIL